MKSGLIVALIAFVVLFTHCVIGYQSEGTFISITLFYNNGNLSYGNVKLLETPENLNTKSEIGDYQLTVFSFEDKPLYETKFSFSLEIVSSPPEEWFDDEGNQIYFPNATGKEKLKLEKASIVLFIPYFDDVKNAKVFYDGILKLNIDLSNFSICNHNSICENKESFKTCPTDCPSGSMDDYCDKVNDGVCDPDCLSGQDSDCKIITQTVNKPIRGFIKEHKFTIIMIASSLILLAALFIFFKKKVRVVFE